MRTFKRSELEGVTGWETWPMIYLVKYDYAVGVGGYESGDLGEHMSDDNLRTIGCTPLTGEPLVAALRERGVEVVDNTEDAKPLGGPDDEAARKWADENGYEVVGYRLPKKGESFLDHLSNPQKTDSAQWDFKSNECYILTPKAKIAAYGKPEVKPTEADELRKELDEAKATNARLRDSLIQNKYDKLQPAMSDERFLQEASIAAMQGMMASGNETTFPLTGEGSQNLGAWAVDYAELTLKALKARKEGHQ